MLAPGMIVTFELRGEFASAGTWESAAEVLGADGEVTQRFDLAITRSIAPVPADLVPPPQPARVDLSFPNLWLDEPRRVLLTARNGTQQPLELAKPTVLRVAARAGESEVAAGLEQLPWAEPESCAGTLPAGRDCAVALLLPEGLDAGRYAVDVALPGVGGGQSAQRLSVDVRASFIWALLLVAVGALLGASSTGGVERVALRCTSA